MTFLEERSASAILDIESQMENKGVSLKGEIAFRKLIILWALRRAFELGVLAAIDGRGAQK